MRLREYNQKNNICRERRCKHVQGQGYVFIGTICLWPDWSAYLEGSKVGGKTRDELKALS